MYRSAIIQEAKAFEESHPGNAVIYYYCEYREPHTQVFSNILGSLVKQLAARHPRAFEDAERFWDSHNSGHSFPQLAGEGELQKLLIELSRCFQSVSIIIDGLDECIDLFNRSIVLEGLTLLRSHEASKVKLIVTSRDEIDIRHALSDFPSISIAAQSEDVRLFVTSEIEKRIGRRTLQFKDLTLKEHIIETISSMANGM